MFARNRSRFTHELRASLHTVSALSLVALSNAAYLPSIGYAQVPAAPVISPQSQPAAISPSDRTDPINRTAPIAPNTTLNTPADTTSNTAAPAALSESPSWTNSAPLGTSPAPAASSTSLSPANDSLFPALALQRQQLADTGLTFQNNLTQFYFGNTAGGAQQEFRYAGHGDYLANFDFGKMIGTPGAFLKVRAEHRFGETINDAAGVLMPPTVAGDLPVLDSTNLYLTNVLFTQALSESFVLYTGKLDTLDGDMNAFAHGRGIRQFSNSAFVANPIALRTIPYSTLGAGMAWLLEGEPWLVFNVLNATDTTRTAGFDELFNDGVALASEMRIPTNFFGKPGHQLFAGTWNSRDFTALDQDPRIILPNVPIAKKSGSWSLYWNCDQYLVTDAANPKRGWGYFSRAGISDQGTNPVGYFLSSGIGGSSPMQSRERDSFGIGYYFINTSDEIAPFLSTVFGGIGDGQGVEMFYNIATGKRLTITPDMQVLNPSRENLDTALVVGLRANYNF